MQKPVMESKPVDAYLKEAEVADFTGFTRETLRRWRVINEGPPYHKVGPRAIRYLLSDILNWMSSNRIVPPDPGPAARRALEARAG